ncbi:MAG: hypothetical protein IJL67_06940 [Oscillospiraceae bacterium]|nr:hypothetical protein [Oscillospiraceae bacterium]
MTILENIVDTSLNVAVNGAKKALDITKNVCSQIFEKLKVVYKDNFVMERIDKEIDISYLKVYKKRSGTVLLVAKVGSLLKYYEKSAFPEWINSISDEYIIGEYDESSDRVVQADFVIKEKIAENIITALDLNDGVILIKG